MTDSPMSIEDLVRNLQLMKAQESYYRALRVECEKMIEDRIPGELEGTETREVDGFKVRVARKLNRTIDEKAYRDVAGALKTDPIVFKPSLDLKVLRAIETADPEGYKLCQSFITVKPAKTRVTIEEIKEEKEEVAR